MNPSITRNADIRFTDEHKASDLLLVMMGNYSCPSERVKARNLDIVGQYDDQESIEKPTNDSSSMSDDISSYVSEDESSYGSEDESQYVSNDETSYRHKNESESQPIYDKKPEPMPTITTAVNSRKINEPPKPKKTNYNNKDVYGALIGRSVEDFYSIANNNTSLFTTGTHDFKSVSNAVKSSTKSSKLPSIFVMPNTRVMLTYDDGKYRQVVNRSTNDDLIYVDSTNVNSITVSKLEKSDIKSEEQMNQMTMSESETDSKFGLSNSNVEGFHVDGSSMTFTYFDMLVILLVVCIIYYLYTRK